ncbi:PREDICTED: uncharacterized protein LOC105949527 [Erythranthe guttata]|uniref:uncharacterized protein LOC105949527 n=1 Tax=Erythranthe guttata TaxID=4155 RepID=UPI00064DE70B|nr:PREDICTED: uncharacterized protein LOC105949527 [Erythranthe guttata]|eukprot:XP_012828281.1 PREDICTED: uncharacterized protein LOC105949527 [Erythranthe guttata]
MENQRDFKAPKFKPFDGALSPLNALNFSGRRYNTMFDPYASDSSNSPSPLMKYLRCADPSAAAAASRTPFISPVKVEEDVIVMDGIPVPKSSKGSGDARMRSPLTPSNSVNCSFTGYRSPSPGSGVRATGIENIKYHRNKPCRFWETGGICQFGSDCQFAHGKEELRSPRSSGKIKIEISKSNSSSSVGSNSSSYGKKRSPISKVKAAPSPSGSANSTTTIPDSNPPRSDWSPCDDGIDTTIPCGSMEEDVDAYIARVLYGTNSRKRLAVFEEICPENVD